MENITAISLFIEVDGRQYLAALDPDKKDLFMGMLPAFQSGDSKVARICPLPEQAVPHLLELRQSLFDHLFSRKESHAEPVNL